MINLYICGNNIRCISKTRRSPAPSTGGSTSTHEHMHPHAARDSPAHSSPGNHTTLHSLLRSCMFVANSVDHHLQHQPRSRAKNKQTKHLPACDRENHTRRHYSIETHDSHHRKKNKDHHRNTTHCRVVRTAGRGRAAGPPARSPYTQVPASP